MTRTVGPFVEAALDRALRDDRLFTIAHIVCAVASIGIIGFVWVHGMHPTHIPLAPSRGGPGALALISAWPFLASWYHSRYLIDQSSWPTWPFFVAFAFVAATCAATYFFCFWTSVSLGLAGFITVCECFAFFAIAERLLPPAEDHMS